MSEKIFILEGAGIPRSQQLSLSIRARKRSLLIEANGAIASPGGIAALIALLMAAFYALATALKGAVLMDGVDVGEIDFGDDAGDLYETYRGYSCEDLQSIISECKSYLDNETGLSGYAVNECRRKIRAAEKVLGEKQRMGLC